MNESGERGHSWLVPDYKGNDSSFCPFSMILAVGLSQIAFIILRYILSIPSLLRVFSIKGCWILWKAFSASIGIIFVFGSVYVVDYVDRLAYVEPALHPWDEAYLITKDKLFGVLLQSVCQYFIGYFLSILIIDIGLKFSFFVLSLLGLISGWCWSHKMIWEGFPLSILFKIVSERVVTTPLCMSHIIQLLTHLDFFWLLGY